MILSALFYNVQQVKVLKEFEYRWILGKNPPTRVDDKKSTVVRSPFGGLVKSDCFSPAVSKNLPSGGIGEMQGPKRP